jgi:hypothetical protein
MTYANRRDVTAGAVNTTLFDGAALVVWSTPSAASSTEASKAEGKSGCGVASGEATAGVERSGVERVRARRVVRTSRQVRVRDDEDAGCSTRTNERRNNRAIRIAIDRPTARVALAQPTHLSSSIGVVRSSCRFESPRWRDGDGGMQRANERN